VAHGVSLTSAAFAQAANATLATLDRKLRDRYPSVQVETLT
jgi:hypothetical protein